MSFVQSLSSEALIFKVRPQVARFQKGSSKEHWVMLIDR
ncbi:predicted protein [Sclerotinia sclerotiorum 1980 UF-70]|uniref:Uncharacterized protein n=1 Tax=Sclerotinia sclerotiorum (strain ATCC 18683 / 1980 / Ss-1) TaxID=665079 RepID=A7F6G1_SCLS1|nr:predicted protein [Sclerotinia sclerotiorum 1980 UF-70]EDN98332.1 predicted protein [Sclerotinia sclerotiorum 1980 UF-70]